MRSSPREANEPAAILADNDLNEQIIDGLLRREPTVEITHLRDHDLRERADVDVLRFAAERQLIVISHDVNTMPAAAYERMRLGEPMSGLIMVRQTLPVATVIENLVVIWAASETEEWAGQVWFLPI